MNYTTKRTRRHIIQSLINLLHRKRFTSITVQDICDEALIHRSSFYRYHSDKYGILEDLIYYLVEELENRSKQLDDYTFYYFSGLCRREFLTI
ncbi:TetR/AcrR family transcriptional regulator [Virgibacillus proomii]|jgi:AcrR family transcriptional regulator|uniref:TetR/AcrR family transcriptional regulator n=1 Tax=Virgibacillus proomii TaxID=84407 RepID=UPI001180C056|nr:TetR/AcrR family transcriptional regulator [Virgibacillus proomii]